MSQASAGLSNVSIRATQFPDKISTSDKTQKEDSLSASSDPTLEDVTISDLPVEIVANIFKYLSLLERLNASLVCKKWHEAGSFPVYSLNEKLVFNGFQNIESFFAFLSRTKREILNLEFRKCELSNSTNLFLVAEKIHSLRFIECKLSFNFKIKLFTICQNLYEFYFKSKDEGYHSSCFSSQIIKSLAGQKFVNRNLKIFRLYELHPYMKNECTQSLFKMFPNIQYLALKIANASCFQRSSPNKFSFDSVVQEIIIRKSTLISLKMNSFEPQLRLLTSHSFTRLKEISLTISDSIPESLIFDFFSRQESLERISCSSIKGSSFCTRFFEHLISRCSNLKYLKLTFRISCFITFSPETFRTLVSSNLISLKINHDIRLASYNPLSTDDISSVNKSLRVLRIPLMKDHRVQCLFVQCFRNLKFLELGCYSGEVVESIGYFQKNLLSLKMHLFNRPRDYVGPPAPVWNMCHVKNCLSSLTDLKSLDLRLQRDFTLFDCEFVPPSVKYFRLCFSTPLFNLLFGITKHDEETLRNMIRPLKNKTELETIYFVSQERQIVDLTTWLEVCGSLNKLRQLCLHCESGSAGLVYVNSCNLFTNMYRRLFKCCPSLRRFMHRPEEGKALYGYDPIHKKMASVDDQHIFPDDFVIFGSEKIAGSKIKFTHL